MKLIILSGDNKKYCELWMKNIKKEFEDKFENIITFSYEHWDKPNQEVINLDEELQKLIDILKPDEKYIIFAKTVGTLITLKGIYENKLHPQRCIFLGIPVVWARLNNFKIDKWIGKCNNTPTLVIQKENDPAMNYDDLKQYLNKKNIECQVLKLPGRDMYYENNFNQITKLVNSYLNESISLDK